ncbi:hypothetical protein [Baekduia alba]|uniref:hypothetical protein n=1 Tax=Baekduia alba TaxID=2997333 RepID=UPI0023421061|nr:hypothetical protein [Baekduia alba]
MARHLIPENGLYDARSALLDDDGNVYMRGPTAHLTSNQLTSGNVLALWEGVFAVGRRTIGAGSGSVGVMGPGDTAWRELGVSVLLGFGGGLAPQQGEYMFVPGPLGAIQLYAGGLKTTGTSAGTAAFTKGSAAVTGTGTLWASTLEPGSLVFSFETGNKFVGVVQTVNSNTSLTLVSPWRGLTTAGNSYAAGPMLGYPLTGIGASPFTAVTVCGGRVLWAMGKKLMMSKTVDPDTGESRLFEQDATDFHEFSADIVGLATLRDRVFVFTKAGISLVSNVALEIVDPFGNAQHRVERVSGDVILRSQGGMTAWRDQMVVAAVDGVYLLDSIGGLRLVSRSITPLWQSFMKAGSAVGQIATFRDHVLVPAGGQVLVGRLDRTVKTPAGDSSPWTRWVDGEAGGGASFVVQDPTGSAKLVAGTNTNGYLLDLTGAFIGPALPATATAVDANGAGYGIFLETREFQPAGGRTAALVQRLMLEYESSGGSVAVGVSRMQRATPGADPLYSALATAPAGNYQSQSPRAIAVRVSSRRVSFTFATGGSCSGLRIRGFVASFRQRGLSR